MFIRSAAALANHGLFFGKRGKVAEIVPKSGAIIIGSPTCAARRNESEAARACRQRAVSTAGRGEGRVNPAAPLLPSDAVGTAEEGFGHTGVRGEPHRQLAASATLSRTRDANRRLAAGSQDCSRLRRLRGWRGVGRQLRSLDLRVELPRPCHR